MSEALDNLDTIDEELQQSVNDDEAQQKLAEDQLRQEALTAARASAAMGVGVVQDLLVARWHYINVDSATRDRLIDTAAPVVAKYGLGLPDWLKPWEEEIALGMVIASAGYGIYMQVQRHNAEKDITQNPDNEPQQTEQEPVNGEISANQPQYVVPEST